MKISILTLFPEMFKGPLSTSIIGRAIARQHVVIEYINIRDFATNPYKTVDDRPFGGGVGMILKVDVVDRALKHTIDSAHAQSQKIILLDPGGIPYTQKRAKDLSAIDHLMLICGHYEGVDHRIRSLVDEQISIGDYVVTGGEIPAMVVVDSIVRLIPGVLKDETATTNESFSKNPGILEYPQYTRPAEYKGMKVPDILLSGNHKEIATWQRQEALRLTRHRRPDLISQTDWSSPQQPRFPQKTVARKEAAWRKRSPKRLPLDRKEE